MNNLNKTSQWFPDYFTIDPLGLDALTYFLLDEFKGKTVKIIVEEESEIKESKIL